MQKIWLVSYDTDSPKALPTVVEYTGVLHGGGSFAHVVENGNEHRIDVNLCAAQLFDDMDAMQHFLKRHIANRLSELKAAVSLIEQYDRGIRTLPIDVRQAEKAKDETKTTY